MLGFQRVTTHLIRGVSAISLVGCLAEPPIYVNAEQIPPFVIEGRVSPSPGEVFVVPATARNQMAVSVPFRSEDLGENIIALFYLDLRSGDDAPQLLQDPITRPPGSFFQEQERELEAVLSGLPDGCHTVTLVLTQQGNFTTGRIANEAQVGRVVWWVNVQTDDEKSLLEDCPTGGVVGAQP